MPRAAASCTTADPTADSPPLCTTVSPAASAPKSLSSRNAVAAPDVSVAAASSGTDLGTANTSAELTTAACRHVPRPALAGTT